MHPLWSTEGDGVGQLSAVETWLLALAGVLANLALLIAIFLASNS
ncbi:hypothetical protein FBZ93_12065 [Bradyrhizobium macuxiense]|uniref:Uncharacterized protein n=1 Tax=Bradyrhizobium macuxiense TaxID=1755647 RepID=A0A560KX96_9BRAD|nr:hypothetical protein FBZ93_12065 [Bradyrhizobium macuxiense]